MPFYIKRPVEYEIIRWSGKNISEMSDFISPDTRTAIAENQPFKVFVKNQYPFVVRIGDSVGFERGSGYFLVSEEEFLHNFITIEDFLSNRNKWKK